MFQLSECGRELIEEWNRSSDGELYCYVEDCGSQASHTCPQHCSDLLFCFRHRAPIHHSCKGCDAVLVEDCTADLTFVLHVTDDERFPGIISQITVADRLEASFAGGPSKATQTSP